MRQTLVGANIRPDRHWLPNAARQARCVPPPETRGIRATARPDIFLVLRTLPSFSNILYIPVPQDSADVCSPAFSLTAYGCLLFLAIPVWTVLFSLLVVLDIRKFGAGVLDNIGTDWCAEYSRQRVCRPAGLAISADYADCRTLRHLDGICGGRGDVMKVGGGVCRFRPISIWLRRVRNSRLAPRH